MGSEDTTQKTGVTYDHTTYLDVFTWRYGSDQMRAIWSVCRRARGQRQVWLALATAQAGAGLVTQPELDDLRQHVGEIDLARTDAIEKEIGHDVAAALRCYAEQCVVGGGKLGLGSTSEDVSSNLDIILSREALSLIIGKLDVLINAFIEQVNRHADLVTCGYTHLQSATPTTVGYRLANYLQDLLVARDLLAIALATSQPKGLKGTTGTRGSYESLLEGSDTDVQQLEDKFLKELGLPAAFKVTSQVYPRSLDTLITSALSQLAQALHKFCFDLRILQSSPFNEMSEPFGKKQVGSTGMPWKKNPVNSENVCSLTRVIAAFTNVAWVNGAFCGLDRTLDESASRRVMFPLVFLAMDECLTRAARIVKGLVVKERVIARNRHTLGLFGGIDGLMNELVTHHGQDRQQMHELLRECSMHAWEEVEETGGHNLTQTIVAALAIDVMSAVGGTAGIQSILERHAYNVGDAPERARNMASFARARG